MFLQTIGAVAALAVLGGGGAVASCSGPVPRPVHHLYVSASEHARTDDGVGCVPNGDDVELVDGATVRPGVFLRVDPPAEFGDVEDVAWQIDDAEVLIGHETCLYGAVLWLGDPGPHTVTVTVYAWSGDREVNQRTVVVA